MSRIETRISRVQLHSALAGVLNAVERSSTLPILSNVLVRKVNGHALFTASDNVVQVTKRLDDVVANEEFSFTAQAKKFADIVSAAASDDIKLVLDDGELKLNAGRGRYTLRTLPADDYPMMNEEGVAKGKIAVSHGHLKAALTRTCHASLKSDITRQYLNSVQVCAEGGTLTATATDGFRLARASIPCRLQEEGKLEFLLPLKTAQLVQRYLSGDLDKNVDIDVADGYVRIKFGDTEIVSKLNVGKFPDCDRIIQQKGDAYATVDTEALKGAIKRACVVTDEASDVGVKISIDKGVMSLSRVARNTKEESHDEIDVQTNVDGIDATYNEKFLLDMIDAVQGLNVKLAFSDSNPSSSPVVASAEGDSSWLEVIMPIRI